MHKKTAQAIAKTTSEVIGYGVLVTDERGSPGHAALRSQHQLSAEDPHNRPKFDFAINLLFL